MVLTGRQLGEGGGGAAGLDLLGSHQGLAADTSAHSARLQPRAKVGEAAALTLLNSLHSALVGVRPRLLLSRHSTRSHWCGGGDGGSVLGGD